MKQIIRHLLFFGLFQPCLSIAQIVEITNYSINNNGQVQLKIDSSEDSYYILNIKDELDQKLTHATSLTLGINGTAHITEPLIALPITLCQIIEISISEPADTDNDGTDDLTENNDLPTQGLLNKAPSVDFIYCDPHFSNSSNHYCIFTAYKL
ncbi:MAG: hypothetical protein ACJA1A_002065 [Saprospiraceae bacterium]|jgi:hypothetical protein|tara:strand:- start:622 stop:1080 length:459 start_codon:yes stop_codon:yes gene_type:complete